MPDTNAAAERLVEIAHALAPMCAVLRNGVTLGVVPGHIRSDGCGEFIFKDAAPPPGVSTYRFRVSFGGYWRDHESNTSKTTRAGDTVTLNIVAAPFFPTPTPQEAPK